MLDPDKTLLLAAQVAAEAEKMGIKTALIGAAALAVHGYARGTEDIDLATSVRPLNQLEALAQALRASALGTELRYPDDDDPLGGVLVVWQLTDGNGKRGDVVEVVNFLNPAHSARTPASLAIQRAIRLDGIELNCVALPDLVALKLYAGGSLDYADIVQLLARNPDADLNEIRNVSEPFDERGKLNSLIEEAQKLISKCKS
jgi:predicted nucleotidyltransferase